MQRVQGPIKESHQAIEHGISHAENLEYYRGIGSFIKDYTMKISGTEIKGDKIFLSSGARPLIPPIKGLDAVPYLTNENVYSLQERPKDMIIIGGGYIAVEFAHFFSAVGTAVTIFQREDRLIPSAEPELSAMLKKQLDKRMKIYLNTEVIEVQNQQNTIVAKGREKVSGKEITVSAEKVFVAVGRKSNADLLKVENTGVLTNSKGYIQVNDYLETSKENIWAFGDAIGKAMFKHVANEEAVVAWRNAFHEKKMKMDYQVIPYAVFTYPEIAVVGLTEAEAKKHHQILVGMARYADVAKGDAMMEYEGFAKAIVEKQTGKILGFHIIGPYAPMLIQEVINGMALGGNIPFITHGMHIHPALPELILRTLGNLSEV